MKITLKTNKKLIMCYGKTAFTPGRYLEDGLRSIGANVDVYKTEIDFGAIDFSEVAGVLFVESPSKPAVKTKNIDLVTVPKLLWVHHGENRIPTNVKLAKKFKADLILMAHSLHLAKRFPAPVRFFPFAMAKNIFNSKTDLNERPIDISFVGSRDPGYYQKRRIALKAIKEKFSSSYKLSLNSSVFVNGLAEQYSKSKIVVNHTADTIKSLNMRIFEGMGCGALVITDFVPGQDQLFRDQEHYVLFKNHAELLEKIDYYLTHPKEAQKIASAGHLHLLSSHTYEHRAHEIFRHIEELAANAPD
ncbi:CgeB family protein [Metabacillus flavus]|uniref:CgeB family protein n=1 Tax=Metabacillus flavus TaxID=2823519 RepID=UPI003264F8BF